MVSGGEDRADEGLAPEFRAVWELTEAGGPETQDVSPPPPASVILQAAAADHVTGGGTGGGSHPPGPTRRWWWGAAAAAMLLLTVGSLPFWFAQGRGGGAAIAAEFRTGPGEMATVRLGDGSIVRLAPESRLSFTGRSDAREVELEGTAFFAVEPTNQGRFIVRTALGETQVLGTRFEVRVREDSLRVLVVEGQVAVSVGDERILVDGGNMMLSSGEGSPSLVAVEDELAFLGWMDGWLVFQGTPLAQVAREVQRRYGVTVHIEDEELAARTVTAWFADEAVEEVITVICRVAQATCVLQESSVMVYH